MSDAWNRRPKINSVGPLRIDHIFRVACLPHRSNIRTARDVDDLLRPGRQYR